MHKLKEMLMNELYEYEEKAKRMSGGKISQTELEKIHKLTDTVKNIDKIKMYEEFSEDFDESSFEGGSSYARGGGRGRGRNARRDSMGRYSREGGSSYEGGYSEEGSYRRGGSSYEVGNTGGQMGGGSSYARGGQGGGRRGGGSSYSYDGAKDRMIEMMEDAMEMAESEKERKAIHRCMQELENA